jgi:signal transduction histidine kinase
VSPAAARTTARRLVGAVVVLTTTSPVLAAAGAVALDGPTGPLWWAVPLLGGFALALAAAGVAVARGRSPDPPATALVALGLVTALSQAALLHAGAAQAGPSSAHGPWPSYVVAAATQASAVLARNVRRAWLGVAATTAFSALVAAAVPVPPPLPQGDGGARVVYAAVLALVAASVFYLARGLEQTSGRVGEARGAVLRADAEAEAMALAEAERGRWEAAVHDDVLTALRAAAAADSHQEVRDAADAAKAALESIAMAPATLTVGTALAAQQVGAAARSAFEGAAVELTSTPGTLPGRVVEALADATVELMRNTVHHNPPGVRARVHGHLAADGARVVVGDDGGGFDADALPTGRLGLRVSVVGRMRSVGGDAEVSSSRRGTTVRLRWPR